MSERTPLKPFESRSVKSEARSKVSGIGLTAQVDPVAAGMKSSLSANVSIERLCAVLLVRTHGVN